KSQDVFEYNENGNLTSFKNDSLGTYASYDNDGLISHHTVVANDFINLKLYREYFTGTKQVKNFRYYLNNKQDSIAGAYFSTGQQHYRTQYRNNKRNGYYIEYNEEGKLVKQGQFKEDKMDSLWLSYGEIKVDSLYYKDGKLQIKPSTIMCSCIDTSYSMGNVGYAGSLSHLLEYPIFKNHIPGFVKPVDSLNYSSIFYTGLQTDNNWGAGFATMNLMMVKDFALKIPADEQIKLTFNPCRTEGYISRMETSINYDFNNTSNTFVSFSPKRISLEFLSGPLKSHDKNFENYTAFFDVERIELNRHQAFEVKLKPNTNPCFVPGQVKNFIEVKVIQARPLIFENPKEQLFFANQSALKLTETELDNFFGLMIEQAEISFNYTENNQSNKIIANSDYMLAGGKFVAGKINIPCKKTGTDSFEISQNNKTIKVSSQGLKMEWLKNGFTRLKIIYNEERQELNLFFFAE
ncbi:MAG: hypothetical protein H0X62_14695, partial [Bacteroidetes bacterium]|nr:hypothetical protein [Bacteroidota bacterium]